MRCCTPFFDIAKFLSGPLSHKKQPFGKNDKMVNTIPDYFGVENRALQLERVVCFAWFTWTAGL